MPKLFKDDDYVAVSYSTRREHLNFVGRVVGYENRKYLVKSIVMEYSRQKEDIILHVNTYEMKIATPDDFKKYLAFAKDTFNNIVKDQIDYPDNSYYNNPLKMLYSSFVYKRMQDKALRRNFTTTKTIERSNYVQ